MLGSSADCAAGFSSQKRENSTSSCVCVCVCVFRFSSYPEINSGGGRNVKERILFCVLSRLYSPVAGKQIFSSVPRLKAFVITAQVWSWSLVRSQQESQMMLHILCWLRLSSEEAEV